MKYRIQKWCFECSFIETTEILRDNYATGAEFVSHEKAMIVIEWWRKNIYFLSSYKIYKEQIYNS